MKEITLEMAEKMLEAAERWAALAGYPSSIAVVDKAGAVIAMHRMDGAGPMTTDISINKAFSAVYSGAPTLMLARMIDPRMMGETLGSGGLGLLTQARLRLMFIPGGNPIRDGDMKVIGGIGCSGIPAGVGEISDTTAVQAGYAAIYEEYD
ncbi:MAG: heme-binding protein [Thermoplasmata archaeon]|nr:heme-binding protein [Thermoplasmata archaeon]